MTKIVPSLLWQIFSAGLKHWIYLCSSLFQFISSLDKQKLNYRADVLRLVGRIECNLKLRKNDKLKCYLEDIKKIVQGDKNFSAVVLGLQ